MQMTMRWFGPEEDKVSLEHIRQVPGVEGVVGALYDVAVGEVWPEDKIERLVSQAHAAGLKMEVIESVNIHDDIKIGLPSRDRYIANYQQTIRHLARFGVKVICYNFMPVFDWMKTDMNYVLPDGSLTMAFEKKDIDKRLEDVVKEVLGLPRVVKNRDDLDWICRAVDSPANGITLCTGSIAEDPDNDVYAILAEFTRRKRIHFAHVRNIKLMQDKDFYECAHPSEYGSLDMYKVMQALHDNGFDGYIRPDHGRFIWGETGRPGYGLYDRALGVTYLKGLWEALSKR